MSLATIYLLDDDPDMLSMLSDMIEDAGLAAEGFLQGKAFFESVDKFENETLLVLDLNMPEMDGIEVMRRLATMKNPPALILISGHDVGVLHSAEKLGKAHSLEIVATLDKPIQLDQFQKILQLYNADESSTKALSSQNDQEDIVLEGLLDAINSDQLILHYQPQIDINTEAIVSCEALIRWQHPRQGMIFPDQFIGVAEAQGWMGLITNWVLQTAVKQALKWTRSGHYIPVSVNVSASDITSLSLPEKVTEILSYHKLNPTMLTLEVTESVLMGELVTSLDILTRLRLKGLGLSIDDFGTGYSSLSQLHKIPFSELKIDREFVSALSEDEDARAIVKTCIMLGHELNMQVVAEGVETQGHFDILKEMGCDIAQGYYFGKPVSAEEMSARLAGHK